MPRQASSAANDSQPTRRTLRKWAYDDDVILVSCMVDLHNIGNYNADTGFKTGYLLELERMMARKLPNSNIKGKPHIESRIKTLKKDWSTIFDMVQGCGNSGFRWDSIKNMVTAEEPVWESYLISHKDATQFRVRSFAFYKQLCQIYAKDRALRRDAQTAANILEEIVEEGNAQTATNIHDAEDGNQSHLGLEDMDISSTQCLASTSASTKKRKAHGMGESIFEESFIKAATLLGNKMEIVGRELSKSIGSEMIIQQRVQELYGALCEIDNLTEDELDNVLSKIPNQPNQLLVFFSLSSTRRLGWVKRFLANNS